MSELFYHNERPYAVRSDVWFEKWPVRFEDEFPEEAKFLQEVVLPRMQKWPRGLVTWQVTDEGIKVKFAPGYYPQRNKPCICGSGKLLKFCCEFLMNF